MTPVILGDDGIAFSKTRSVSARTGTSGDAMRTCSTASWLDECLERISSLYDLEANWDSYGALPIDPESIANAEYVIRRLAVQRRIEKPAITASPSGFVAFCWDKDRESLDVEITSSGYEFSYVNDSHPELNAEGVTEEVDDLVELLRFQD